jgi:hypothetical protein
MAEPPLAADAYFSLAHFQFAMEWAEAFRLAASHLQRQSFWRLLFFWNSGWHFFAFIAAE